MSLLHTADGIDIVMTASLRSSEHAQGSTPICMTVTLLDGLVLGRSTFHHSMNYRSCVILGTGEAITDLEEKRAVLEAIVEHIVPGRNAEVRPPPFPSAWYYCNTDGMTLVQSTLHQCMDHEPASGHL